jgi:hypothetical protein
MQATARRDDLRDQRRFEADRLVSRYREPLVHAAFELQSRIFNLTRQNLADVYYQGGTPSQRAYVVDSTCFLVAQYFAWVEIIRNAGQFLDVGEVERTRDLYHALEGVAHCWLRDDVDVSLRVFRIEQRAIGEEMIRIGDGTASCVGYAAFIDMLSGDRARFVTALHRQIETFLDDGAPLSRRLILVQTRLIDVIEFLDPNAQRFPHNQRTKLAAPRE